jgi:peptidoglycan glycosyltransferase
MNAPLRRVGVVVLVLFALLFVNLNYVQAYKSDDYRTNDHNGRVQVSEYERQRGTIEIGRGVVLAESTATPDDRLKYLRTYPKAAEYAHVVGYKPVNNAAAGVEKMEDLWLSGDADAQFADRFLAQLTGNRTAGGNVLLTLSPAAQDAAFNELSHNNVGSTKAAAVAIDPKTGALLAAVSIPTFDPNPLASHDTQKAGKSAETLNNDPANPLLNRAFSEVYPPGSTFKVIDTATALTNGLQPDTQLVGGSDYQAPDTTQVIHNSPGVVCDQKITLKQALTVSCNTAFSRLCVEQLSADKIKSTAQAFGFEEASTFDHDSKNVLNVTASHTGSITDQNGNVDRPGLAQSCIGQNNVRMTPLQGALIAATVANGGSQMRPYIIDKELAADRTTVNFTAAPRELRQPINGQVAGQLQDMMQSVVRSGTGTAAQIPGFDVGGKTGTAQHGDGTKDHGWFIGYAMKNGEPIVAVAVFLEDAGSGGSKEATRIGGAVMKAVISERGLK